jgi:hypothetical protein
MRLVIARPAASSLALLIRVPVDNCCIAVERERSLRVSAAWVTSEFTLVLMTDMENAPSH